MRRLRNKPYSQWHALLLFTCILVLSACAANRYQVPVNTFHNQTLQTIGVLSEFYSSRNSYEIDLYLQSVAADSSEAVITRKANGLTVLGKPVFSPASIKARLDALNLVGIYAGRLYDLSITDAPTTYQTAATTLGQNLTSLAKTFQTLRGAPDPSANKYIGPISSLIGTIGQMYLNRKRDELIAKAITDGAPQVNVILSQVRDDMENIFAKQITTGSGQKMQQLIVAYNRDRRKLSFEQRTERLSQIKAAAAEASASMNAAPANLVTSMMDALKALVQAASSSKKAKPASLAVLNSALEAWTTQLQSLSSQMKFLIH